MSDISREEWLKSLKVGDEVVCAEKWGHGALIKITRETATRFYCGESWFHKKDGQAPRSDGYYTIGIDPVTQEWLDKKDFLEMQGRIFSLYESKQWKAFSKERLAALIAALKEGE